MRMRPIRLGVAVGVLTLGFVLVSHGETPAPQAEELIQSELKYLKEEGGKPKILKKAERKLRMSAVILAAAAKTAAKGKEGPMGHVATKALELAKALDGDHDAAKKIIADLASGKHPSGKLPASFKDALDFDVLMRIFSSEKVGGFGLEKELEDVVDHKGAPDADLAKKIMHLATKISLISDISLETFPFDKEEGAKTKKAWTGFSQGMSKASHELIEAAAKKSPDIAKVADRVSKTCTACHDVFR